MAHEQHLSELLIGSIRDPSLWREICELLAKSLSAKNVILTVYKKPNTAVFTATDGNSTELVDSYWQNERAGDVWLDRTESLEAGAVTRGSDLIPEEEMRETGFFQNYLSPLKIGHLLTGVLINDDNYRAFIGLMRSPEDDDFDLQDVMGLTAMLPQLQLGVASYLEVRQQKMLTGYVADGWLSVNNAGLFILGPDHRLIYRNGFADLFIAEEPSLSMASGRLIFLGDSDAYQQVQNNIWLASQPGEGKSEKVRFQTIVRGEKLFQMLFVNIAQFSGYVDYGLEQEQSCMVLIQSLDQTTNYLDEDRLSLYWSLTAAEIRVVRGVCDNLKINEISRDNDVSVHTVRAQLKSVYEKMGVHSQASLLRLVAEDSLVALPSFTNLRMDKRGITYEVI